MVSYELAILVAHYHMEDLIREAATRALLRQASDAASRPPSGSAGRRPSRCAPGASRNAGRGGRRPRPGRLSRG